MMEKMSEGSQGRSEIRNQGRGPRWRWPLPWRVGKTYSGLPGLALGVPPNLTSRTTLSLCQWTSIFGDRSPGAVTGLQTLTQECTVKRLLTPQTAPGGKGQSLSP